MLVLRAAVIFLFVACLVLVAYGLGYNTGHQQAHKTAYDTRHVSEGLEMACAGLWIGEQNKIYAEKNK